MSEGIRRRGFADGPHLLGAVTLLARLAQDLVTQRLESVGVSFAQAVTLVRLWQVEDGTLSQSELIDRLALSRASGSLLLSELEELGLVERSTDPNDGRRQIVSLTASGRAIESKVHDAFEDVESLLFTTVGSTEWKNTYLEVRSAIDTAIEMRAR